MSERLFKTLLHGRVGRFSGVVWPEPGEWFEVEGDLIPAACGLHLCRAEALIEWLAPEIWEAESEGERIDEGGRVIARKARLIKKLDTWNEKTARLFVCDCAEHVLGRYEKRRPKDRRPRKAIETARRYIEGKAEKAEVVMAAEAAWEAACDLHTKGGAAFCAALAAGDAADDASDNGKMQRKLLTWSMFWDKAMESLAFEDWHAELVWQTGRLMEYLYPEEVKR